MSVLNECFVLSNGRTIPKLGFGTWQTLVDVAPGAVKAALAAGYTHIDTARAYRNESGVGRGLRESGIPRENVFVTTKVPAQDKSYAAAKASIETSLRELDAGYVDLLLIHAPKPWPEMGSDAGKRYYAENAEVWRAMEEACLRGDVRSIGVSNFDVADMANILHHCAILPVVNQICFHIGYTQDEITARCQEHHIVVEAYSPIATGELLDNAEIGQVAKKLGVSVAQLCIRYALQKGCLPLPKSTHEEYIVANTQVDFTIGDDDMAVLDAMTLGE